MVDEVKQLERGHLFFWIMKPSLKLLHTGYLSDVEKVKIFVFICVHSI